MLDTPGSSELRKLPKLESVTSPAPWEEPKVETPEAEGGEVISLPVELETVPRSSQGSVLTLATNGDKLGSL